MLTMDGGQQQAQDSISSTTTPPLQPVGESKEVEKDGTVKSDAKSPPSSSTVRRKSSRRLLIKVANSTAAAAAAAAAASNSIAPTSTINNTNVTSTSTNEYAQDGSGGEVHQHGTQPATKTNQVNVANCNTGKSGSRKWGTWQNDDTKWFFEALAEHGKDFSAIQTYMASRFDKKLANPVEQVKSREQVRHYYYRTWHKISSSITFPEYLDKQTQELYSLINFGEIWKKLGSKADAKIKHHLNELVNTGQTLVKFNGKNLKIKTPVCKALKKLHKLDDSSSSSSHVHNLPKEVTIEFHPATNDAWMRVHSLAQNPRLRIKSPLQKRLSEVIAYLERRWSTSRIRSIEMATHNRSSPTVELEPEKLRVFLQPSLLDDLSGITIKRVPLNLNVQIDLSLSAFLQKFHQNNKEMPEKRKKSVSSMSNNSSAKAKANEQVASENKETEKQLSSKDSNGKNAETEDKSGKNIDTDEKSNLPPIAETVRSLSMLKDMLDSANEPNGHEEERGTNTENIKVGEGKNLTARIGYQDENSRSEGKVSNTVLPLPPANATIGEWLGAFIANGHGDSLENKAEEKNEPVKEKPQTVTEPEAIPVSSEDKYQSVSHQVDIDVLKKGWTTDATDLLVGELYLMLKNPEKIVLEYEWDKKDEGDNANNKDRAAECKSDEATQTVLDKLLSVTSIALLNLKNQQNGGDSNLTLSPVKSKSYSRKNKRLKLSSPPPPPQPPASSHHQQPSLSSSSSTASPSIIIPHDRIAADSTSIPSSHFLSTLISDTILNDNVFHQDNTKPPDMEVSGPSSPQKMDSSQWFGISASPAPKASSKPNKVRCNDPALIQEAIKQLNSNKFNTRKPPPRKPAPKPTYMPKPILSRCPSNVIGVTFPAQSSQLINQSSNTKITENYLISAPIINHVVKTASPLIASQITGQTVQLPMVIPSSQGNIVVSQGSISASFLANPDC